MKYIVFSIISVFFFFSCSSDNKNKDDPSNDSDSEIILCDSIEKIDSDIDKIDENNDEAFDNDNFLETDSDIDEEIPAPTVSGIKHKETYQTSVLFQIKTYDKIKICAFLDKNEILAGKDIELKKAGFHRVVIESQSISTGRKRTDIIEFVILDAQRGEAEWGLPPWVPQLPVTVDNAMAKNTILQVIHPKKCFSGISFPVALFLRNQTGQPFLHHFKSEINGKISMLKRGYGSAVVSENPDGTIIKTGLHKYEISCDPSVAQQSEKSGTIDDETWTGSIIVTGSVTIPSGIKLTISEGTVIVLKKNVNFFVKGSIFINGTNQNPVLFASENSEEAWGGFVFDGSASKNIVTGAFFTGSGGNTGMGHGHSLKQPLFMLKNSAEISAENLYIIENHGQAFGSESSSVTIKNSLIQKCVTGGEITNSNLVIENTFFSDFPEMSSSYLDSDNDALYISGSQNTTAVIKNSFFMYSKDDCLDSGGSGGGSVLIENSWFEGCFHEGIALSGDKEPKSQKISNSVFTNCGQGIELGYSGTDHIVEVEHSLFMDNYIGIRYGDNYEWETLGNISIGNSISINNFNDTWNFVRNRWGADTKSMNIENSIFSVTQELYPGNLVGEPEFDENWRITAKSIGYKKGSDGKSIGLTE